MSNAPLPYNPFAIKARQLSRSSMWESDWLSSYEQRLGKLSKTGVVAAPKRKVRPLAVKPPVPRRVPVIEDSYVDWLKRRQEIIRQEQETEMARRGRETFDHQLEDDSGPTYNVFIDEPEDAPHRVAPQAIESQSDTKRQTAPRFQIGIEFEGMLNDEIARPFRDGMCALATDSYGDSLIQFGVDNSVKQVPAGFSPVEIRTSIMSLDRGLEVFELMLSYLYLFSQTGDFKTNSYCGLHINLSETRVFADGDQKTFYYHVLSLFDEDTVLQTFNRVRNRYCLAFFRDVAKCDKDIECISQAYRNMKARERAARAIGQDRESRESKYLAVSLRDSPTHDGYAGEDRKAERIEFRCIGNTDYHLRWSDLKTSVDHMLSVCSDAYDAIRS